MFRYMLHVLQWTYRSKLKEHNMLREVKRKVVRYGQSGTLGDFRVEFIRTNPRIAAALHLQYSLQQVFWSIQVTVKVDVYTS